MTITYRKLTLIQQYQIQSLLTVGWHQATVAQELGCHRSTISRELARCPSQDYCARRAQKASGQRRHLATKHTRFNPTL